MRIETGQYSIVNIWQHNLAHLPDSNDGTPITGNPEQNNSKERVSLIHYLSHRLYSPKYSSGTLKD